MAKLRDKIKKVARIVKKDKEAKERLDKAVEKYESGKFDHFLRHRCIGYEAVDNFLTETYDKYKIVKWQIIRLGGDSFIVFVQVDPK